MKRIALSSVLRFGGVALSFLLATVAVGGEAADRTRSEDPPIDHGDVAVTPIRPEMDSPPTHGEVDALRFELDRDGLLESFAVDNRGNLLLAFSRWKTPDNRPIEYDGQRNWIAGVQGRGIQGLHVATGLPEMTPKRLELRRYQIRRISPRGKTLGTWPQELTELKLVPKRIAPSPGGDVYIAGAGCLVRFGSEGDVKGKLEFAPLLASFAESLPEDRRKTLGTGSHASKTAQVAGLAANGKHVFFCLDYGPHRLGNLKSGIGAVIGRCNGDLSGGKIIQWDTMIGCCRDLKIVATENEVIAGNNNLFRVSRFDSEGKRIAHFGNDRKRGLRFFVGCCDPMGIALGPEDSLYVLGVHRKRVWRFTLEGRLLGTTAHLAGTGGPQTKGVTGAKFPKGCYAMIHADPDGNRLYAHDLDQNAIRRFVKK